MSFFISPCVARARSCRRWELNTLGVTGINQTMAEDTRLEISKNFWDEGMSLYAEGSGGNAVPCVQDCLFRIYDT